MTEIKQTENKNTFDIIQDEDDLLKIKKNELALKYLKVLNDPIYILRINQSLNALKYTIYFSEIYDKSKPIDSWLSLEFQTILIDIYFNLIKTIFKHNDYTMFKQILSIIKNYAECSKEFCLKLAQSDSTHEILFYLLNSVEVDNVDSSEASKLNNEYSEIIIIIILSLSQFSKELKDKWSKCDPIEALKKFSTKFNNINSGFDKWYAFLTIENLECSTVYYDSGLNFATDQKESQEDILKKLNIGIKYLKFLNEPSTILNCLQSMNLIYYMEDNLYELSYDDIDETLQDSLVELIMKLLKSLTDSTIQQLSLNSTVVDFINFVNSDLVNTEPSKSKKKVTDVNLKKNLLYISKLATIIQNLSNKSVKFCIKTHRIYGAIKTFFEFVRNETVSDYLIQNLTKKVSSNLLKECYQGIIGCIHNLSRVNYKFKSMWDEFDAVKICIRFSEKLGPIDPHYRFYVYMILANIATDEQIDTLQEIRISIQNITELMEKCSESLENKEVPPLRTKIQINENEDLAEILAIENDDLLWHLVELIEAVYHLSVNDNIKKDIYNSFKMKDSIKKIIYNGNEVEKEFSLKLLYQLCFDDEITKDLINDKEVTEYLINLKKDKSVKRKGLLKNCNGILFMLNIKTDSDIDIGEIKPMQKSEIDLSKDDGKKKTDDEQTTNNVIKKSATPTEEQQKHIMISYNRDSREVCLSIKARLEKLGYDVWIDVEDIKGSSLESMANAIENSQCVLMAMTEKYKLSSNCRLEAEYAVQLNKYIIPLILQKDYKPDGWLGIILGSKMFINFKKYDFEECIRRLKLEVDNAYHKKKEKEKHENNGGISDKKKHVVDDKKIDNSNSVRPDENKKDELDGIIKWNEAEVDKWLNEKNIHPSLIENIKPCNGKILFQMYLMLKQAPEFFYTAMRSDANNKVILKDLALFSYELNSIFKND